MRRARIGTILSRVAVVAGVALVAVGIAVIVLDGRTAQGYRDLAAQVAPEVDEWAERERDEDPAVTTDEGASPVDWDALLAQNADTCAWLNVAGTTVDVPVLRAHEDDPEHWLYRDIWGNRTDTGVPYLDYRCSPDGDVMVVYGHRTLYESYLFHDISPIYDQGPFDAVGDAVWATPGETTSFEPLCAASVSMSDPAWQRFSFDTYEEMREWLAWAVDNSGASSPDAELLSASARRVLVLVTCNGRTYYPTTRTIAVFVSPFPAPSGGAGAGGTTEGSEVDA